MFFVKVLLHHVLFLLFCTSLYCYVDSNIYVTILASFSVYVVSYFVSLWTIKILFLCAKVKTENKCIFITGCDTGFGYKTALILNKIGYKVFSSCLNPTGEGASNLIANAKYPKKMIIIGMDVTNDKDIEAAYETVKSSMSYSEQLFGLVNNAGIALSSELEWGPDLTHGKSVIDVNCMGMIKVTRRFLPLIRQARGRIINIESLAGLVAIPQGIFYGISKYAAAGFSDNLRIGMYRFGVSVISINPGLYKTAIPDSSMLLKQYESSFRNSSEEVRKAYGENFLEKVKKGMSSSVNIASESNDVPKTICSALTAYEPDPRYIVAPIIFQPLIRILLWIPKETWEVSYQITTWILGIHRVYPDDQYFGVRSQ